MSASKVRAPRGRSRMLLMFAVGPFGQSLTGASAAITIVACVVAAAVWLTPSRETVDAPLPGTHIGAFSYAAEDNSELTVYDDGRLRTGDPMFLSITPIVNQTFTYRFESPLPHEIRGEIRFFVEVGDITGWRRTEELAPLQTFEGDEATVSTPVDIRPLMGFVMEVERLRGSSPRYYTAAVRATVTVEGTVAGEPFTDTLDAGVTFRVEPPSAIYRETPETRILAGLDPHETDSEDAFIHTRPASVSRSVQVDRSVPVWLTEVRVSVLRFAATTIAILAALTASALVALNLVADRVLTPSERILGMYGEQMIEADLDSMLGEYTIFRLVHLEDLLRVAASVDAVIVHEETVAGDIFGCRIGQDFYVYQVPDDDGASVS